MGDWTFIRRAPQEVIDGLLDAMSFDFQGYHVYIFENDDTGKRVMVVASSIETAGRKLGDGDYIEMDDED